MFKTKVKRCVTSEMNHAWYNIVLPAIESTNSKGKYCAKVDPSLTSQDILDVLKTVWSEEYLCEKMLSRFIAVLADDKVRTTLQKYCVDFPDATQEQKDNYMQDFVDSSWNVSLKHPESDRKVQSIKSNQTKATNVLKDADTEVQTRVAKQMLDANPELAKELAKLLK